MDIRTTPPEDYARMLLEQGVPPDRLEERMAHDMLVALAAQIDEQGVPEGFEPLAGSVLAVLMKAAKDETKQ